MRFGERVVGTPRHFYQGNLAFGMGDGELTNQHPAWQILQEMLWEILWEIF